MARREEEEYSTYCDDEQRSQPRWIGAQNHNRYLQAAPKPTTRMPALVHGDLPNYRTTPDSRAQQMT